MGRDGRVVPEVIGITEVTCHSGADLKKFYDDCMENRSTSTTKLNDRCTGVRVVCLWVWVQVVCLWVWVRR